jgi:hypothetical protein
VTNNRFLAGVACIAFGIFGAVRSWNTHTAESAIAHAGVRAEARVTRKWTAGDSEAGEDYMLGYSFELPGRQHIEAEHKISEFLYRSLRQGDSIEVLYSPTDPQQSFPEGQGLTSRNHALVGSSFGALIALFGVGVVLWEWRGRRAA